MQYGVWYINKTDGGFELKCAVSDDFMSEVIVGRFHLLDKLDYPVAIVKAQKVCKSNKEYDKLITKVKS